MKKKKVDEQELLFQTIDDDPRLANTINVDDAIETNIEDLFKVVGTSDEKIYHCRESPYF